MFFVGLAYAFGVNFYGTFVSLYIGAHDEPLWENARGMSTAFRIGAWISFMHLIEREVGNLETQLISEGMLWVKALADALAVLLASLIVYTVYAEVKRKGKVPRFEE